MTEFKLTPLARAHMERIGATEFDMVGYLPQMLNDRNPASAVTQLHLGYAHGGGWHPFEGFSLKEKDGQPILTYPGDPPTLTIAEAKLRDERVILFQHAWVAVVQPDGSFTVARMD